MKEILINVSKETRMVDLNKSVIGNDGENLQGKLVFTFIDEFVNGQARLEYEIKGNKNYVVLDKENNTYTIPVKNVITKEGQIDMQLVITEGTDEEEIPVFKSNKFYLFCNSSINAVNEAPDGYELWIEQANVKLNQIDEALLESETQSNYAKEQGDYAKEEATKVDEVVDYVVRTSEEAIENSETAISISKGANQSLSYGDYETMITAFNNLPSDTYKTGQNILIITLNVPDLWISGIEEENTPYTFVDDDTFVNELKTNGIIKVGYYVLSALETQKVDLTEYVKNNDYATSNKGGVIRTNGSYGTGITSSGYLIAEERGYAAYSSASNYMIIGKGTLEAVLNNRVATETQFGTIKAWTSTNEDREVGLNISTEV